MGFPVYNEQDCPLLTLTNTLCAVPSSAVITHYLVWGKVYSYKQTKFIVCVPHDELQ